MSCYRAYCSACRSERLICEGFCQCGADHESQIQAIVACGGEEEADDDDSEPNPGRNQAEKAA